MRCFITRTASYLPGSPVSNDEICQRLGQLNGEEEVREKILSMNGIRLRHYAQDQHQQATHDVYELGSLAAQRCLEQNVDTRAISLLVGGTTFAPLAGPGFVSILHERLSSAGALAQPVEISSHAGICSSATTALVAAIRAVAGGHHGSSLCVGAEHASDVLKAKSIRPIDDRADHVNVRNSRWFMSVFLRFMLSDGAGAFLLQDRPDPDRLSLQVNWTHAMSFANEAPLCMKLDCRSALLSQDLSVLSTHLFPTADKFLDHALETHDDTIDSHTIILPHMSSFFFRRKMERVIAGRCSDDSNPVPYWTNLETAGNTGAASIFVMLDQYLERRELSDGDRMLLFVPESGQFNFVLISLTAGAP